MLAAAKLLFDGLVFLFPATQPTPLGQVPVGVYHDVTTVAWGRWASEIAV